MQRKWQVLTPTEKYCSLLQTWLCRSDLRLIDRNARGESNPLADIVSLFKDANGSLLCGNLSKLDWKYYFLKLYNLALLEMFGMVTVKDNDNLESKNWSIATIHSTEYGKKWVSIFDKEKLMYPVCLGEKLGEDEFQKKIKKIFPKWQAWLQYEKKAIDPGVHVFKVSLGKDVWRRLAISGTKKLEVLADCILNAFNFDDEHLYQFTYTDRCGVLQTVNQPDCEEDGPYVDELKIGEIDILPGDSMEFLFAFGEWRFNVQLEKIESSVKSHRPTLIEKFGRAPKQYRYAY